MIKKKMKAKWLLGKYLTTNKQILEEMKDIGYLFLT